MQIITAYKLINTGAMRIGQFMNPCRAIHELPLRALYEMIGQHTYEQFTYGYVGGIHEFPSHESPFIHKL